MQDGVRGIYVCAHMGRIIDIVCLTNVESFGTEARLAARVLLNILQRDVNIEVTLDNWGNWSK